MKMNLYLEVLMKVRAMPHTLHLIDKNQHLLGTTSLMCLIV